MINLKRIFPFSEFQTSRKLREEILASKEAYLLTSNGKPYFVVQNIQAFEELTTLASYGMSAIDQQQRAEK